MCMGCYEKYGSPSIVNEKTERAAELIDRVYEWSVVGGNAHIVLDDWNLEDEHVAWCREHISTSDGYNDYPEEQLIAERECLAFLADLSLDERASALAIYEGFSPALHERYPDESRLVEFAVAAPCRPVSGPAQIPVGGDRLTDSPRVKKWLEKRDCRFCEEFFELFRCSAYTHLECDCPKCQGYCECEFDDEEEPPT